MVASNPCADLAVECAGAIGEAVGVAFATTLFFRKVGISRRCGRQHGKKEVIIFWMRSHPFPGIESTKTNRHS